MREETKTIKVYSYSELSEKAKRKSTTDIFRRQSLKDSDIFEDCEENLKIIIS